MTLFPRHQGGSHSQEHANRCRAHRLLDRARAGLDVDPAQIHWALVQTGDAGGVPRVAEPVEPQQEAA
jgi:hypothetical protein